VAFPGFQSSLCLDPVLELGLLVGDSMPSVRVKVNLHRAWNLQNLRLYSSASHPKSFICSLNHFDRQLLKVCKD